MSSAKAGLDALRDRWLYERERGVSSLFLLNCAQGRMVRAGARGLLFLLGRREDARNKEIRRVIGTPLLNRRVSI